jgi:hypothetical protein
MSRSYMTLDGRDEFDLPRPDSGPATSPWRRRPWVRRTERPDGRRVVDGNRVALASRSTARLPSFRSQQGGSPISLAMGPVTTCGTEGRPSVSRRRALPSSPATGGGPTGLTAGGNRRRRTA